MGAAPFGIAVYMGSENEAVLDTDIEQSKAPSELPLDPFAFHAGAASRITGLGGTAISPSLDYAFHTPYVQAAPGPASFKVCFQGLAAKTGTLLLRVHMLSLEPGARARMVNSERVSLNRLIHLGGEISINFEGFQDVAFALVGLIPDETDARAEALTVTLNRPADPRMRPEYAAEAKGTAYGSTSIRPAATLLSTEPPNLACPVTQIATGSQLLEPLAKRWLTALPPQDMSRAESWRRAYTLQALDRYGMLQQGAVGLGFEPELNGMMAAMVAASTSVVVALPVGLGAQPGADILKADLNWAAVYDPVVLANAAVRSVPWDRIPDEFVNFDFLWSTQANDELESVAAAVRFVEQAMVCLRPGGVAVHTMSYELPPGGPSAPSNKRIQLQQGDVERIALVLVSRGHEVAQFKIDTTNPILVPDDHSAPGRTMVGIIVRKGRLHD